MNKMTTYSRESNAKALMELIEKDSDGVKYLNKRLLGWGVKNTGNYHDAEELVGDFWLKITRYAGTYKANGDRIQGINDHNLSKWFNKIFYHLIVEYHRRKDKIKNQILESDFNSYEDSNNSLEYLSFSNRKPDDEAIANEEADILKKGLFENGRISEKERRLLVMYYFESMPQEEIAEVLEIPKQKVRARMCAARKTFKGLKEIVRLNAA